MPVHFGQVTAYKAFMDRTDPLLRHEKGLWKCALRNKLGGAISVGAVGIEGRRQPIRESTTSFLSTM
jgi:multimeric flavodoxin WrbA